MPASEGNQYFDVERSLAVEALFVVAVEVFRDGAEQTR